MYASADAGATLQAATIRLHIPRINPGLEDVGPSAQLYTNIQRQAFLCIHLTDEPKNSQFGALRLLGFEVYTADYQHHDTL